MALAFESEWCRAIFVVGCPLHRCTRWSQCTGGGGNDGCGRCGCRHHGRWCRRRRRRCNGSRGSGRPARKGDILGLQLPPEISTDTAYSKYREHPYGNRKWLPRWCLVGMFCREKVLRIGSARAVLLSKVAPLNRIAAGADWFCWRWRCRSRFPRGRLRYLQARRSRLRCFLQKLGIQFFEVRWQIRELVCGRASRC